MEIIDYVIVDSKDRITTSSGSTDFSIHLIEPARLASYWKLVKISFPLIYDNIVTGLNDTCTIDGNLVTIPSGHYDISSLVVELNAQSPAGAVWTWEPNSRLLLTYTGAHVFLEGTLARTLGFDDATYAGSLTYEADWYPNLALNKDYYTIHSRSICKIRRYDYIHTDDRSNIIATVPVKVAYGQMLPWEPEDKIFVKVKGHHMDTIDFQIRDSAGTILDLQGRSVVTEWIRYS